MPGATHSAAHKTPTSSRSTAASASVVLHIFETFPVKIETADTTEVVSAFPYDRFCGAVITSYHVFVVALIQVYCIALSVGLSTTCRPTRRIGIYQGALLLTVSIRDNAHIIPVSPSRRM